MCLTAVAWVGCGAGSALLEAGEQEEGMEDPCLVDQDCAAPFLTKLLVSLKVASRLLCSLIAEQLPGWDMSAAWLMCCCMAATWLLPGCCAAA